MRSSTRGNVSRQKARRSCQGSQIGREPGDRPQRLIPTKTPIWKQPVIQFHRIETKNAKNAKRPGLKTVCKRAFVLNHAR